MNKPTPKKGEGRPGTVRPNGNKIRDLRENTLGYSREKFIAELEKVKSAAEKLEEACGGKAGVSLKRLAEIERGATSVFPNTLRLIARVLDVDYEELVLTDEP